MVKNKSVNKILYILLAFLIAAAAIVLPFTMNKKDNQVYADESGFTSSFISTPQIFSQLNSSSLSGYYTFTNVDSWGSSLMFSFSLQKNVSDIYYTFSLNSFVTPRDDLSVQSLTWRYFTGSDTEHWDTSISTLDPAAITSTSATCQYMFICSYSNYYVQNRGFIVGLRFVNSSGTGWPVGGVVDLGNIVSLTTSVDALGNRLLYTYLDNNGLGFSFVMFNVPTIVIQHFNSRTYYLKQSGTISDSVVYENGYNEGYQNGQTIGYDNGVSDGYAQGQSEGYNDGYTAGNAAGQSDGYDTGYSAGDAAGYIRGLTDSNQYTFTNLISATIDAPVQALTGLLNFEILGVNLSAFIYGLFTITLVIVVIKYIKGGK